MNKQDNGAGTVVPIRADTAAGFKVEPPTNHAVRLKARGTGLFMGAGQGEDENLVCLYDLVAWLVEDRGLPLLRAVERVANEIEGKDEDTFWLIEGDYANPHNPDSPWRKFTDEKSLASASVRVLGMQEYDLSKLVNVPGYMPDQSTEFDESKESPFEFFGRMDSCRYALTWRKAHELFGWGRAVTVEAAVQTAPAMDQPLIEGAKPKKVKAKDMSPQWTGQRLLARKNELRKNNVKFFAAQTAIEAGLKPREVSRRIEAFENGGVTANVSDQLKAVGAKNKAV